MTDQLPAQEAPKHKDDEDSEEVRLDGRHGRTPWQKMTPVFASRTAAEHASHLLPHIKPHHRILDIGCGVGSITLDLAALVPQGSVVGIDTNPETTGIARDLASERGMKNVEFRLMDAKDLVETFGAEAFDVVHMHQVLLHLPASTRQTALTQIHALLRPDTGLLSTRDNILFAMFPDPHNVLNTSLQTFTTFSAKAGADFHGGVRHHVWVHDEGGFSWDRMEVSHVAWGYTGLEERRLWAQGVGASQWVVEMGVEGTGEEKRKEAEWRRGAWEEWAESAEGKLYALDGVVLARK